MDSVKDWATSPLAFHHRSETVAVSCLFFLVPAAAFLHVGEYNFTAFVAAETALWSIAADYFVQAPAGPFFTRHKISIEAIDR